MKIGKGKIHNINGKTVFWIIQLSVWTLYFIYNFKAIHKTSFEKLAADKTALYYIGLSYLFLLSCTGLLLTMLIRYIYKRIKYKVNNLLLLLLTSLFLSIFLAHIWLIEILIFDKIIVLYGFGVSTLTFTYYVWEIFQGTFILFSWSLTYLFIKQWIISLENKTNFENAVLRAENSQLKFLQYQLNPHFLFNSLNNINSFAQRNSEKTSFAIIKLSEIIRYMLYEGKNNMVLLDKEIKYISNYLELQKLRFSNNDFIDFKIKGDTSSIFISPMLFISFIENAFKHGRREAQDKIEIRLEVSDGIVQFICKNKIRELNKNKTVESGGLGLENVKQRLELLYPNKHQLIIDVTNNIYKVNLILSTNGN